MNRQLNFNAPFKRAERHFRIREALLPGQKRLIILLFLLFCLASSCSVKRNLL